MRAAVTIAVCVFFGLACSPSRGCEDSCEAAIEEDCALDAMEPCPVLCEGFRQDAETSGCVEAWLDLEYCLGLDPVCAAHSRCAEERELYNGCLRR